MAGKDDMGGTAAGRLTAAGSGVAGTALGAAGGAETHRLTGGQMPRHSHHITDDIRAKAKQKAKDLIATPSPTKQKPFPEGGAGVGCDPQTTT